MHKFRKIFVCSLIVLQTAVFSSCGFHSQVETKKQAPVAKSVNYDYFTTVDVARGDVVSAINFVLSYKNSSSVALSFSDDRARIDNVYVSVGDYVHNGDILIQCNSGKIKNEIAELEVNIKKLEADAEYFKAMADIESDRKYTYAAYGEIYENPNSIDYAQKYDETIASLNVSKFKLEELNTKLSGCSIYATMDGYIGYIAQTNARDTLKANATAITITDGIPYFLCTTTNTSYFKVGDKYQLGYYYLGSTSSGRRNRNQGSDLPETDTDPEGSVNNPIMIEVECTSIELINENTGSYSCKFKPLSSVDIPSDKSINGRISIQTGDAKDVLYIPTKALIKSGDDYVVYVQNDNGERSIRKVEVGVLADDVTEIQSGLELGDVVLTNSKVKER